MNIRTPHGNYHNSLLKSYLQKSIRRCLLDDTLWCIAETYTYYELNKPKLEKCISTNLINRLAIIVVEDICIGNVNLVNKMRKYYDKYIDYDYRNTSEAKQELVELVSEMVKSEKLRSPSHIKAVYLNHYHPQFKKILMKKYPDLYKKVSTSFEDALVNKREDIWMFLPGVGQNKKVERKEEKYWKMMKDNVDEKYHSNIDNLQYFHKMFFKRGEEYIFFVQAVLTVLNQDKFKDNDLEETDEVIEWTALFDNHVSKRKIPKFALDIHTSAGSKINGLERFALVGAKLENICEQFNNKLYEQIYLEHKKWCDLNPKLCKRKRKSVKTQKKVSNILRKGIIRIKSFKHTEVKKDPCGKQICQKRTSKTKKFTYLIDDKIVKGPYKDTGKRFINNVVFTQGILHLEKLLGFKKQIALKWSKILIYNDVYYFEFKNVGDSSKTLLADEEWEDLKLIERGSFVDRVSDIDQTKKGLTDEQRVTCLQHLYLRFVLGIGDSGTHNMLKGSDDRIYGIDLEDMRTFNKFPENKMDMLFVRVSKKRRKLYEPHLDDVKVIDINNLSGLSKLGYDDEYLEGIKTRIKLFDDCEV